MDSEQLNFIINGDVSQYLQRRALIKKSKVDQQTFIYLFKELCKLDNDLAFELCKANSKIIQNLPNNVVLNIIEDKENNILAKNVILLNCKNFIVSSENAKILEQLPLVYFYNLKVDNFSYISNILSKTKMDFSGSTSKEKVYEAIKNYFITVLPFDENYIMSAMKGIDNSLEELKLLIKKFDCLDYIKNKLTIDIKHTNDGSYLHSDSFNKNQIVALQFAPMFLNVVYTQKELDLLLCDQIITLTDIFNKEANADLSFVEKYKESIFNKNFTDLLEKARNKTITHNEVLSLAIMNEQNVMSMAQDRYLNEELGEIISPLNKGISECVLFSNFTDGEKQKFIDSIIFFNENNKKKYGNLASNDLFYIYNKSFVIAYMGYNVYKKTGEFVPVRVLPNGISGEGRMSAAYQFHTFVEGNSNLVMPGDIFTVNLQNTSNIISSVNHECKHREQVISKPKNDEEKQAQSAAMLSRIAFKLKVELLTQYPEMQEVANFRLEGLCSLKEFEAYHEGFTEYSDMLKRMGVGSDSILEKLEEQYKSCKITDLPNHYNATANMLKDDIKFISTFVNLYKGDADNINLQYLYDKTFSPFISNLDEVEGILSYSSKFINSKNMNKYFSKHLLAPIVELEKTAPRKFSTNYAEQLNDDYKPGNEMYEEASKATELYTKKLLEFQFDKSKSSMIEE